MQQSDHLKHPALSWWVVCRAAMLVVFTMPLQAWAAKSEWLVRNWQVEDGLPDNTITAIAQTPDGYLWLGTFNGLARFDGVQFKTFDLGNTPELRSSHVVNLLADPSGVLWIGTEGGGLVRMVKDHFESVPLAAVGSTENISSMFLESDGSLWLAIANKGVVHLKDGKEKFITDSDLTADKSPLLTDDPAVQAWLSARNNILMFQAGSWFSRPSQVPPANSQITAIQRSRNGSVWMGFPEQVAKLAAGGGIAPTTTIQWKSEFSLSLITQLIQDETGELWLGTLNNGLFHSTKTGGFEPIQSEGLLSQNLITSLHEDQNGLIWAGTYRGGLFRIKRRTVDTLSPPDAGGSIVLSVCPAHDGGVWLGTGGAGLYHYKDGKFTHYTKADGLLNVQVCSVIEDQHTNLWAGTWGGLFRLENNRFQQVIPTNNFPERVLALFEDRAGNLWVGTYGGLACKRGDNWTLFTMQDGLSNPDVRAIAEDREGDIWIGTVGGGVDQLRHGQIMQLGPESAFPQKMVVALSTDQDDALWIGTIGGGLWRYKDGSFTTYTKRDGLADDVIGGIISDTLGNLWLNSQNGILRVSKQALNSYVRGQSPPLPCLSLSMGDGLTTPMSSGSGQPVVARTADGRLWIPNMKAVAVLNPKIMPAGGQRISVIVKGISIDGQDYVLRDADSLRIPIGRSHFEFYYTVLGLPVPEAARFRYKLEGLDNDWVAAGVKRLAYYDQLPAGAYRFRVMAAGGDGTWYEARSPLTLQIVPRWWETWWIHTLMGAAILALVGLAVRMVERRKLRSEIERMRHQQAISEERARIARDIHDDMGSRLTDVGLLGALVLRGSGSIGPVREDVSRMVQKIHEMVSTLDEIVWAVNPKNDSLGHLATYLCQFAKEFLEPTSIACRLDIPSNLPAKNLTSEVRHNIFLATREALNNVVKHAYATKAWLRIKIEGDTFVLEVTDNGKGFSRNSVEETSDGLNNMAVRITNCGGHFQINSTPSQGTTVCFRLPLAQTNGAITKQTPNNQTPC